MTNLSVAITAEIANLEAKLAVAKENLRAATSNMRALANEARTAGASASGQLSPGLLSAAEAAAKAKAEVAGLKGQLEGTGGVASSFRERISLAGKGLDSLRLRIADYTSLASKFGELLVVGFAGERIIEGINRTAELGEQILKLSRATGISTETLSRWHFAAQQLGIDTATIDTAVVRLAKSIQEALMSPTSAAAQSFNALGLSQEFLRAHSNDLRGILLKVSDAIHNSDGGGRALAATLNIMGRSAADMVPFLQQGSAELARLGEEADRLGVTISGPQAEAMERYEQATKRLSAAWQGFWITITTNVSPALTQFLDLLVEAQHKIGDFASFLDHLGGGSAGAISSEISDVTEKIAELKAQMSGESGLSRFFDAQKLENFERRLSILQRKLAATPQAQVGAAVGADLGLAGTGPAKSGGIGNLLDNTAFAQIRLQFDTIRAKWAANHDEMLRQSVKFWQGVVKNTKEFSKLDETQQIEAKTQLQQALFALNSRMGQESSAAAKKAAAEAATIERDKTQTAVALSKIKLQSERDTLQAEVDAGQITAAQKIDALRNLADQEYQLDLQSLEDTLATLDATTAAYQRAYDKILVLKAQHVAQMRALDLQMAVDQKKALDQQAKDWNDAGKVITRSFDQVLTGVLRGTQTWQQAMARLFGDLVTAAIENIAKIGFNWAIGELRRLVVTEATNTQITASNAAQGAASAAAGKSTDKGIVLEDAKVSAANVYKWVSAIPYVGWILAPPAAAAAFAAVAAFGSFDRGAFEVPTDMVAQVHAGEMIVPAGIAAGIRAGQNVTPGFPGVSGSGGDTYNFHIQAVDAAGVANLFRSNGPILAAALAQQIRLGNSRLTAASQPA